MDVLVPVGELSKMTFLGVEELRRYREVGLLEAADVDPVDGSLRYSPDQVRAAHAIRRLHELHLPLDRMREVLAAPDASTRNDAIEAHLQDLPTPPPGAQQAVTSLQAILGGPATSGSLEVRTLPAARVLAVADTVAATQRQAWLEAALAELQVAVPAGGLEPAGPAGVLQDEAFFHDAVGRVTAFVPVAEGELRAETAGTGRTQLLDLPAAAHAVLVHDGPPAELDRTYGALGTAVARRAIGAPGPLREHRLDAVRTEVCWPVRS
jgi:DNA-binding transcriptional MerR regulator